MSSTGRFIHVVRTPGDTRDRLHAAFSREEAARAYADRLGAERNAEVLTLPLDQDYAEDLRTIVDLARDGTHLGTHTRIMESAGITNAFFRGDVSRAAAPAPGKSRVTYRNMVLRLETETLDHEAALRQAREIHQKALSAGIWPPEGSGGFRQAQEDLQKIVNEGGMT